MIPSVSKFSCLDPIFCLDFMLSCLDSRTQDVLSPVSVPVPAASTTYCRVLEHIKSVVVYLVTTVDELTLFSFLFLSLPGHLACNTCEDTAKIAPLRPCDIATLRQRHHDIRLRRLQRRRLSIQLSSSSSLPVYYFRHAFPPTSSDHGDSGLSPT